MEKNFPEDIEESKAINVSLATAIFVIVILTSIELLAALLRLYIPSYTPWLEKGTILGVMCVLMIWVTRNQKYTTYVEAFLSKVNKKKK